MARMTAALALVLLVAGCGDDESSGTTPADTAGGQDTTTTQDGTGTEDTAPPEDTAAEDSGSPVDTSTEDGEGPQDTTGDLGPQDVEPPQDEGAPDAEPPQDEGAPDAEPPQDAGPPDVALDTGPLPDACDYVCNLDCTCKKGPDGCDLPECEPEGCEALVPAAEAALAAAAAGCAAPQDCSFYEYPICGTFGCFQGAVSTAADLTELNAASDAALQAGCSPFMCGCFPPLPVPVCNGGSCGACPPDCGTCEELEDNILALAAEAATGCVTDLDCALEITPNCDMGPQIVCHGFAHLATKSAEPVMQLLAEYTSPAMGCSWGACDCQSNLAICSGGQCVPTFE